MPPSSTTNSSDTLILPMIATNEGVVFPEVVVTIALESDEAAAAAAAATDDQLVLVPRIDGRYARVGTLARIENRGELRNGTEALTIRATGRVVLGTGAVGTGDALWIEATPIEDTTTDNTHTLAQRYRTIANALLDEVGARRFGFDLPDDSSPGVLADTIAYWPELSAAQRVELLETVEIDDRLELAYNLARAALAEVQVAKQVQSEVSEGVENDQREAILRRQLASIQKELGGDDTDVIGEYRAQLAELDLNDATREAITKEIDRFERLGENSQESSWIRTWLDEVLDLPWNDRSVDNLDLASARLTLDADHTGLDEVKERIIEHLAVRKLRADRGVDVTSGQRGSAILTLVGPPGVGKTSLGESIASALGRKFVRLALGGIRDEAEIRGHRRTYVGARPGRIVRALSEAGTMNPVILLDEVDKLGADWRGDPAAALLEVLDPAQNHSFRDHYLEFELDLSDVIFIATANRLDTIPGPLLDRVEVISIDGYTDAEKAVIAADHIEPKLRERIGLEDGEVTFDDDVIARVAADWTREAGVRSLERQIDKLLRKAATKIAADPDVAPITITDADLIELLGQPVPREDLADRTAIPGVATGLAVTGAGGDVLFVEATSMNGEPGLTLTGQLGDVMKESGEIARSYLRSHAAELGIPADVEVDRRFHIHFPAGAVPKDGPSAGVTMTTALVSLLTGRTVRDDVAMTGEISLHGRVLPIGGVKQKLLAAHRAGLTRVILPAKNGVDLDDVPADVRGSLEVHLVETIDEVIELALA